MANNLTTDITTTDTSTYRYIIDIQFVDKAGKVTSIDPSYIRSIVTDYDYENNNIPLMFMTLAINNSLIDKLINNKNDGLFIINFQKYVSNINMIIKKDYIKDKFVYFMSNDLSNEEKKYGQTKGNANTTSSVSNTDDVSSGDDFSLTTIGLMSQTLLNSNKKSVSGVISGGILSSILNHVAGDRSLLMETPTYNINVSKMILPPLNSIAKAIAYINKVYTIYDTQYRFFIDYDTTYLISSSGKAVLKKSDKINTVKITLKNMIKQEGQVQGMTIDTINGFYEIIIPGSDVETYEDEAVDRSYSSIKVISSDGTSSVVDISTSSSNSINAKQKVIRIENDNTNLINNIKNNIKSNSRMICINKCDIDTSIFTINKKYSFNTSDVLEDTNFNGNYILTRKRELFLREDDLKVNVMLIFKKID